MFTKNWTAALLLALLSTSFTACNSTSDKAATTATTPDATATASTPATSSGNAIDAAIDDYEKLAVEYKDLMAKAQKGDMEAMKQMQPFSQKLMDVNKKIQEQAQRDGLTLTPEQQERLKKVGASFSQAAAQ
jgi:hypothetical protein